MNPLIKAPAGQASSELASDKGKRIHAMNNFLTDVVQRLSDENRKQGGDGNVSGGLGG